MMKKSMSGYERAHQWRDIRALQSEDQFSGTALKGWHEDHKSREEAVY
jgi:hypothetical protein